MPSPIELTVSDLRRELPTVLHRVLLLGESFVVLKNGKQFAVLSPIEEGGNTKEALNELVGDSDELIPAEDVLGAVGVT